MMAVDLVECLVGLPSLVSRLDRSRASADLNELEYLTGRTEEYIELLLLLSGSSYLSVSMCTTLTD